MQYDDIKRTWLGFTITLGGDITAIDIASGT